VLPEFFALVSLAVHMDQIWQLEGGSLQAYTEAVTEAAAGGPAA
jgi:hypothetical protein